MTLRTLEERVAELERRVTALSTNGRSPEVGMTGRELVAYMKLHGEALGPIFDETLKLREKDREKARRKFAREDARAAAKKRRAVGRQRAKA